MKKPTVFTFLLTSILLTSCGVDNPNATVVDNASSNDYHVDVAYEFETEAEAVEYYFNQIEKDDIDSANTFQLQNNESTGIYVYSPKNIPQGFSLGKYNDIGSIDYYNDTYRNTENKTDDFYFQNRIHFCWYYNQDGEETLNKQIERWTADNKTFNAVNNMNQAYYVDKDDYQNIYWCEDGYCFKLQIPKSVGSVNPTTHEYSGENIFELQKTFYKFE